MRDETAYLPNILKDYALVADYATAFSTATPLNTRARGFDRHVPHKTPFPESRHWGRDLWGQFDSLPRVYRDMVNNDPNAPHVTLETALALWSEESTAAHAAMDRIVRYEHALDLIDGMPAYLRERPTEEVKAITALKAERLKAYEAQKEAARLAREEADALRRAHEARERRYATARAYVSYRTKDGTTLDKVEVVDTRGLAPHVARQVLAQSQPLAFVKHVVYAKPKVEVRSQDSFAEDTKAPLKIHPNHVARGRNY